MNASEIIRKILEEKGLTQAQLANATGLHPSSIGNYLYGQRKPDLKACLLIAGLSDSVEYRAALLAETELNQAQVALIAKAVSHPLQPEHFLPKKKRA